MGEQDQNIKPQHYQIEKNELKDFRIFLYFINITKIIFIINISLMFVITVLTLKFETGLASFFGAVIYFGVGIFFLLAIKFIFSFLKIYKSKKDWYKIIFFLFFSLLFVYIHIDTIINLLDN